MRIKKTKFKGLVIYEKDTYSDNRGYFRELFKQKHFKDNFPFDVMSYSKKNVIRGLHLQLKESQAKLITVLRGKIFDVCLDCRKDSATFGKHFSIILSDKSNNSLLIPRGFAHGFCALSNDVIMHYKCSNYRNKKTETGILWNDKNLKIKWPVKRPIVSKKDKKNLSFDNFKKLY